MKKLPPKFSTDKKVKEGWETSGFVISVPMDWRWK
jgi:hypothetical protein